MNAQAKVDVAGEYEALLQFLYLAPVGLAQTSLDGEIAFINPVFAQLLMPLSRDGSLTNLYTALENVAPELHHLVAHFAEQRGMICDGLRIALGAHPIGRSEPRLLALSLVKLDESRLMAVLSDITQQAKRERMLKQNEAWLNAILTGITDYAVIGLDGEGRVQHCGAGLERVTGFSPHEVLCKPYSVFYPDGATTPDRMQDRLREADSSGWSLDDGWRIRGNGTRYWGSAMIAPLLEPDDRNLPEDSSYCLIIRDITEQRELRERHRGALACDQLTGLTNRHTFFEAAELEIERWRRSPRELSLLMIDADHPGDDAVLQNLAAVLTETFRQVDIVARVGVEEFAVMLPSTGVEGALAVALRLRQVVEAQRLVIDDQPVRYTISLGVATMDPGVDGLDTLMQRADLALDAAKRNGRNCVRCWPAT